MPKYAVPYRLSYTSGVLFGVCCLLATSWIRMYRDYRDTENTYQATVERLGLTAEVSATKFAEVSGLTTRRVERYLKDNSKAKYRTVVPFLNAIRKRVAATKHRLEQPKPVDIPAEGWQEERVRSLHDLSESLDAMYAGFLLAQSSTFNISEAEASLRIEHRATLTNQVLGLGECGGFRSAHTSDLLARLNLYELELLEDVTSFIGGQILTCFAFPFKVYRISTGTEEGELVELFLSFPSNGDVNGGPSITASINDRRVHVDEFGTLYYKSRICKDRRLDFKVSRFNYLTGEVHRGEYDLSYVLEEDFVAIGEVVNP